MQPRNQVLSEAKRLGGREGSNGAAARVRRRRSGGVVDLGMFVTDGPAPRRSLPFRSNSGRQGAGDQSLMGCHRSADTAMALPRPPGRRHHQWSASR
jgi:hypothetical protein